ncbi:MAG: hypothetical protein MRJ65_01650 [Candidatus Brocadiaceae bacterium]|nr:hypothetical protein [Candidatus Brocadiaceae bacterium]
MFGIIEKLIEMVSEKTEKVMSNSKVEGMVNGLGGILCFVFAVAFGIMFIFGGASLMKTGKNYVVRPPIESESHEDEDAEDEEDEDAEDEEDEEDEE